MSRKFLLDHRLMFLFGYFFYLATPVFVGYTKVFADLPGVDLYLAFFDQVPREQLQTYFIITASWLPAFFAGDLVVRLFSPLRARPVRFRQDGQSRSLWLIAIVLSLAFLAFAYLSRASLFGGYASYDIAARGKLSTLLMVLTFFLMYDRVTDQSHSFLIPLLTLLTAVLLLSMGGRMYVFQVFIVILVYKTSLAKRKWGAGRLILFLLSGFVLGAILGAWRMGLRPDALLGVYSFLAEPAFTWFSVMTYLSNNDLVAFSWPGNFLSSFLNLVPNTLLTVKPYLVSLESMARGYQNPLGADSIWTNLVINFGSIGSAVFMFCTGGLFALLKQMAGYRRFWAVYYLMVCGVIPFQFFRDGFYLLHKQLLFNFLLFPAAVLLMLRLLLLLQQGWLRQVEGMDRPAVS
jgi:hypothetical protein